MKIFNKKGFTFVELIVSVTISVIIFIIIYSFVIDSLANLAISNKKALALSNFYDIYDTIWEYRNEYLYWSLIIDNPTWTWNDVALIRNYNNDKWIIFWIIDKETMKIETWSLFNTYSYKVFWYKILSLSELTRIQTNTWEVYNISFQDAAIFDTPTKAFQSDFFNSWSIFLVNLDLLITHNPEYDWKLWSDIPKSNYELFKLSFTF